MSGNYTAISRFPLRQAPNMLWTCYWNNTIAIGGPAEAGANYFFKSTINGSDSRGYNNTSLNTAFGNTGPFEIQYIIVTPNDVTPPPTVDGCNAVWTVATAPSTAPGGIGNEISVTQLKRSWPEWDGSRPQLQAIYNPSTASTRTELCISLKFRTPDNLSDTLSGFPGSYGWFEILAIKNGVGALTDGRFNIILIKKSGETGMRAMCQFDAGTGGTPIWGPYESDEYTIQDGTWYQYTYYVKQPATGGKNNLTDGICQCIIQNLSTGESFTVVDLHGGYPFYGANNYPITRISPILCYTGGYPSSGTLQIKFSNLEFSSNPRYPLQTLG